MDCKRNVQVGRPCTVVRARVIGQNHSQKLSLAVAAGACCFAVATAAAAAEQSYAVEAVDAGGTTGHSNLGPGATAVVQGLESTEDRLPNTEYVQQTPVTAE